MPNIVVNMSPCCICLLRVVTNVEPVMLVTLAMVTVDVLQEISVLVVQMIAIATLLVHRKGLDITRAQ